MYKFRKIFLLILFGVLFILIGVFIFSSKKEIIQTVPSLSPSPVSTPSNQITYAKVIRVIDGDSIVIEGGKEVRYIGMNTPEVQTSECFATEASEINKNLVLGKTVKLEKDISETDKYGRLLRFVYIGDIFVDDYLVRSGSARVETVPPDVKYEDQFLESEKYARKNNLGLWGKCNSTSTP